MGKLWRAAVIVLLSLVCISASGAELLTDGDGHWVALWRRDGRYMSALSSDNAKTWTKPKQSGTVPTDPETGNAKEEIPVDDLAKAVIPDTWKHAMKRANPGDATAMGDGQAAVEICGTSEKYIIQTKGNAGAEKQVKDLGKARNLPCAVSDGKANWLVAWADDDVRACCSSDNGQTWSDDIVLAMPDKLKWSMPDEVKAVITPAGTWCVIWGDGEFRRDEGDGHSCMPSYIWATTSRDKGKTWSSPVELTTDIENNSDSISRLSTVVANDRIYIAWSQSVPDKQGIPPNSDIVMVSSADGLVWTLPRVINGNARTHAEDNCNPRLYAGAGKLLLCAWDPDDTLGRTFSRGKHVFLARSTDAGETWSVPVALDFDRADHNRADSQEGQRFAPAVATDKKGRWVAVWESVGTCPEEFGLDEDIMTSYSDDFGKSWTPPVPLNADAATDYANDRQPLIAYDGKGRWVTAWRHAPTEFGGWSQSCRAAYSSDGKTWSKPADLPLLDNDEKTINDMRLAALGNGSWLVVYQRNSFHYSPLTVVCTRSDDNGESWKDTMQLNGTYCPDRPEESYAMAPAVTGLSDGACLVMWREEPQQEVNAREEYTFYRISQDGGATWNTAEKVSGGNAREGMNASYVTSDNKGNILATWAERPELGKGGTQLASLSTDNGKTWSPTQRVTGISSDSSWALATDGQGRYLTILEEYVSRGSRENSDIEVKICRSDDGNTWSAPELLATVHKATDVYDEVPSLATDGNGKWMVMYESTVWLKGMDTDHDWVSGSSCRLMKSEDNGLTWCEPSVFPVPHGPQANK